jgi:PAS domain S-box-containing protein
MTLEKQEFYRRYCMLMAKYAQSFDEAQILAIEQLGNEMVQSDIQPKDIGEMHDIAIGELMASAELSTERIRTASLPLIHLLKAYGTGFKMEQTLRKSEAMHWEIMQSAFDAIIIVDMAGKILEVNPASVNIFGYSMEMFKQLEISALIPEHLRQQHEDGLRNYIETGESKIVGKYVETKALHQDGHIFPIELCTNELNHGQGKVMATIRDISRRKQNEASLRKLSSVIEQAGESIVITNRDGIIEYVNPSFTRITGYSAEEAIGHTPRILKSGNQDAAFYKDMWQTIINGKVWHGKVIDRRKDGSFYPAMLTISPIFDASGDVIQFAGIQSDLSKLEDMEHRFHEAQKMEAVGTMVGGVAHNFNNMLAGMLGNLYLAKKIVQEQPDVVQRLNNVEELSHHASEMIQQLLAFARKGMVSMTAMPLTPFIKETLKLLHAAVPENIAVHENICVNALQIKGDATQLHQVLANLISNARDAVEDVDDPCVTVKLQPFDADDQFIADKPYFKYGAYAHLSVSDNGYGISKAHKPHLFEPFFTTKEQGKGTGLGLSMIYGAAKTHHGFVEVDSIEGKGSTFHIYLPLLEPKDIAVETVREQETTEGHGELIMLADDDHLVRTVMTEVLESLGYRVLQAKDGEEAMTVFTANQQEIAVALLDVVMPHCGGMSLAKHIRAMNPDLPVIFLTGYDKDQVLNGKAPLPNSDVLTKPANFDALSHKIQQLIN